MASELANELTSEFFPLVQEWEEDFQKSVLKWIDQAQEMNMPFPILIPLIELVVTKRIEQMKEYNPELPNEGEEEE